jgi:hypothetical protein
VPDYAAQGLTEVWDPKLGRLVPIGMGGATDTLSPLGYIRSTPASYQGYTGNIGYQQHFPLTLDVIAPEFAPSPKTDPRAKSNPYTVTGNIPTDVAARQSFNLQNARVAPGLPPRIAVSPDGTPIDLLSGSPVGPTFLAPGSAYDPNDPVTKFLLDYAKAHQTKLWSDVSHEHPDIPLGRPWELGGTPSPEEIKATRYLQGGGRDPRAVADLANARGSRYRVDEPAAWQKALRAFDIAAIAAGGAIAGGAGFGAVAGPIVGGAAGGAIGSTTGQALGRGEINPYSVLIGAGAGAVGGAVSPYVPSYVSAPAIAAGSGAGNAAIEGGDVGRAAARGATAGFVSGGASAAGVPSYVASPIANTTTSAIFDTAWPDDSRRRRAYNPYV